jgi:hypothetical protein
MPFCVRQNFWQIIAPTEAGLSVDNSLNCHHGCF